MKQLAVAIIVMMCILGGPTAGAIAALRVGEPAQDFTLETLDGTTVRLSQSLGQKATLIVFWAEWSSRSVEALADFQKMYAEHGPRGLQVIAVNVEHEGWASEEFGRISAVVERTRAAYPIVVDPDLSVLAAYGFKAIPSLVLVDATGEVVNVLAGYPNNGLRLEFREQVLKTLRVLPTIPDEPGEKRTEYVPRGKAGMYYQMGKMMLRTGKREKALHLLGRAVAEDPNYLEANHFFAEELMRVGRFDAAQRIRAQVSTLTGQSLASVDESIAQDDAATTPVPD